MQLYYQRKQQQWTNRKTKNKKQNKSHEPKSSSSDAKTKLSDRHHNDFEGADCSEIETCKNEYSKEKSH